MSSVCDACGEEYRAMYGDPHVCGKSRPPSSQKVICRDCRVEYWSSDGHFCSVRDWHKPTDTSLPSGNAPPPQIHFVSSAQVTKSPDFVLTTYPQLTFERPKFNCPKCGLTEHNITISVGDKYLDGDYCLLCAVRFAKEYVPRLTKIVKKANPDTVKGL